VGAEVGTGVGVGLGGAHPPILHVANSKHVTSVTHPRGIASKSKQVTVLYMLQLRSTK
jgi:hypothetical protein